MSLPKLLAKFQPCATDGAVGLETITHSGSPITLDLTAYVVGLDAVALRALREEAGRFAGKDLDHVAEAVPGLVDGHAGEGGYDVLLDADDIDAFFEANGLDAAQVGDAELATLRTTYGTEPGAPPVLDGADVADAPSVPAFR